MMQNSAIEPVKKAVFVDQQRTATPTRAMNLSIFLAILP
jgi:hypothetical protein